MGGAEPIRHALPRVLATAAATCLVVLFAAFGFSADANAEARPAVAKPKPTPSAAGSSGPTTSRHPGLHILVRIGALSIEVDVPFLIDELPSAPPSSAPPTAPSRAQPTPTSPSKPSVSLVSHSGDLDRATGASTAPYPPTPPDSSEPSRPVATPQAPASTPPPNRPTRPGPSSGESSSEKSKGTLVFVKGFVPRNAPLILLLLCVVCAIGVAVVVKLSGRRRRL